MERHSGVFLTGEQVDLCVPTNENDFVEWAELLNDSSVTSNLEVGTFPLNADTQRKFFLEARASGRVLLLVRSKASRGLLGICSLSNFNPIRQDIMTSTVVPRKDPAAKFAPLEALAILVQHAFARFPVQRVWGGHTEHVPDGFIRRREILGFYTGGYFQDSALVEGTLSGSFISSVTRQRYEILKQQRGGSFWPGSERASALIEHLIASSELPLHLRIKDTVVSLHQASFNELLGLEQALESSGVRLRTTL